MKLYNHWGYKRAGPAPMSKYQRFSCGFSLFMKKEERRDLEDLIRSVAMGVTLTGHDRRISEKLLLELTGETINVDST